MYLENKNSFVVSYTLKILTKTFKYFLYIVKIKYKKIKFLVIILYNTYKNLRRVQSEKNVL